jgi:hypothetical protein
VTGLYGGAQLRFGGQWTEGFATYVMAQGLVGSFIPSSSDANVVGILLHSLIFEATLGRVLQLGAGPSLDFFCGCNATATNTSCGASPVFFGLDGSTSRRSRSRPTSIPSGSEKIRWLCSSSSASVSTSLRGTRAKRSDESKALAGAAASASPTRTESLSVPPSFAPWDAPIHEHGQTLAGYRARTDRIVAARLPLAPVEQ